MKSYTFHVFKVNNSGLMDLISFPELDCRIIEGRWKKVYLLMDGQGKEVHRSVLFKTNLLAMQLGLFKYKVIGDCWTSEDYRGYGLYGRMIRYITQDNKGQFVLFVEQNNIASIKGLIKVGIPIWKTVRISRVFKFLSWHRAL